MLGRLMVSHKTCRARIMVRGMSRQVIQQAAIARLTTGANLNCPSTGRAVAKGLQMARLPR